MGWWERIKNCFTYPIEKPRPEEVVAGETPTAESGAETDVTVIIREATPQERINALIGQIGLETFTEVANPIIEGWAEEKRRAEMPPLPEEICHWEDNTLVVDFKSACRYFGIIFNEPIGAFTILQERLKERYPGTTEFRIGPHGSQQ